MNAETLKVCKQPFPLKWYDFHQNNSGGPYAVNDKVDIWVFIQARTPSEANNLAERIGIYFHGCSSGYDCDCCGDRWSEQWNDEKGTDVPEKYGEPLEGYSPSEQITVLKSEQAKIYPYGTI